MLRSVLPVLVLSLVALLPIRAIAAAEPTPAATSALQTAKPRAGCCCGPSLKDPEKFACSWGLSENKCRTAAELLKKKYRWSEGRCPAE